MSLGFILGICASFLWAIVNYIDKYLVERFSKESGTGALIILSALFPSTLLPIAFIIEKGNIALHPQSAVILIFSGILTTIWITLYLYALEDDDASTVMPIFQLTPILALGTAFIFLHEMPETNELIAGAVILFGSLILGYEFATGKMKWKLLFLVGGSSLTIALMHTFFKFVAQDVSFWSALFWHAIGIVLSGVLLFMGHTEYRNQFLSFIKQNAGIGLTLNAANETLTLVGDILFAYAILLAPLALIQTSEAFQPIFVFCIGIVLFFFAPKLIHEDFSKHTLIQKGIGISIVFFGTILLYTL